LGSHIAESVVLEIVRTILGNLAEAETYEVVQTVWVRCIAEVQACEVVVQLAWYSILTRDWSDIDRVPGCVPVVLLA
jgi:hypothetical protein